MIIELSRISAPSSVRNARDFTLPMSSFGVGLAGHLAQDAHGLDDAVAPALALDVSSSFFRSTRLSADPLVERGLGEEDAVFHGVGSL